MQYNEYYDMIIDLFRKSIKTKDASLYNKIFNTLINWYKNSYEADLINSFNAQNELRIANITKQIKKICEFNDYEKVQTTYQCDQLNELNKLSNQIFELVKESIKSKNVEFTELDYEKLMNKFKTIEQDFPKIIFNKFEYIRSECFLDLNYLLNKGNVQAYSLRTYDYLKNQIG